MQERTKIILAYRAGWSGCSSASYAELLEHGVLGVNIAVRLFRHPGEIVSLVEGRLYQQTLGITGRKLKWVAHRA